MGEGLSEVGGESTPGTTWSPPLQPGRFSAASGAPVPPAVPVAAAPPAVPAPPAAPVPPTVPAPAAAPPVPPPAVSPYGGSVASGPTQPSAFGPGVPPPFVPPPGGPTGRWPSDQPAPAPASRRPALFGRVAVLLVVAALLSVTGVQAYQIHQLTGQLADTDRRLDAEQQESLARLDGLEARARELESAIGAAFDPEAIAAAVLPSVFRIRAGQYTGSAFAVGEPAADGGTNLFTNFHVVEEVWEDGDRQVFLERTDQRFPATIVEVDEANDLAQLRTTSTFTGLVAAPTAVKSGQPIVVVGAPLGLEDSVTTGVVSAFREAKGGDPPFIQFDAPINPGNSGGPVINDEQQVVGIATAKAWDAEGISLAVPIATACDGFEIC
ncbi:S1C family serine protease [Salinispora sp. H7-4]|uniref:S1C family serine protease n=1 Tax=Salinispora sp. H7-4 TaxID=2748321 RepID=UPI0035CC4991